ncbi:MAG TPA: AI-2E family transporter [Vicinamibacterales bacterium]
MPFRLFISILGLAALGAIVVLAHDALLLIFAAIVIAVTLRGGAGWLSERSGLSITWALTALVLTLAGMLIVAGLLAAPSVVQQFEQLSTSLPDAVKQLQEWLQQYSWGRSLMEQGASGEGSGRVFEGVRRFFSTTFGAAGNLLIVLVLALYLAYGAEGYVRGALHIVPPRGRPRAASFFAECTTMLRHWLFGQLGAMLFTGIATFVGLLLLGVPFALVLGLLAAALDIIPYIGPFMAAIPAVLVALSQDAQSALYVGLLFIVIQNLEGNLVTPLVQRRAVDMPPAALISAQLLLGVLFGFLGVLVAAPLTVVLMVAVQQLYLEEVLEEGRTDAGKSKVDSRK